MADPTAPVAPAPAKKGGRGKLLLIASIAIVVLAGGGGAAFWAMRRPADGAAHKEPEKKHAGTGVVSFEPFVVNLADTGAQRFLRISIKLVVDEPEEAEHIQKTEVLFMRVRSAILEILTQQTSDQIVTQEGKAALKKAITEQTAAILEPTKVSDVLFSDFVVQF